MRTLTARLISALTAAALPVVLMPAPAQADTIPIVSRTGTVAGNPPVHVAMTSCMIPDPSAAAIPGSVDRTALPAPVAGDEVPPGSGVLRIQQGQQVNLLSGVSFDARPLSELTVFRTLIQFPHASKIFAAIKLVQGDTWWVAVAEPSNSMSANSWHTFDAMTLNYFWIEQPGGLNREEPAMTIEAFLDKYPEGGQATGFIGAGTCDGFTPTTVYVDDFRVSAGANTQVVNFEIPFTPALGIATSATAITNGGSLTVTGTLKYGSTPLAERVMHLYAQVGSATPTVVAKKKTSSTGVARAVVTPTRNTTYTWYFPEAGNYGSKFSGARLVSVRAKVTLALTDSTLRPGQTLVATGRVSPAKVGSVATLWRKTSTGRVKLRSITLTKADGTFRITKVLNTRGTYKVYVTVPAASNNLAGTSPIRTATVS
jgi:hypothetical protein